MKLKLFLNDCWKTLLLSYPISLGQVGTVLMGVTDTIMVGRVGKTELAASGIANQVYFLFVVVGIGTLAAMAPLIATSKGAKNKTECGEILRTGIELSFLISITLCVILFLLGENFHLFHQPEDVSYIVTRYLRVLTISTIPLMLFLAVKQFSDGLGFSKPAMVITVIGLFLNIFFNWIFIYGNLTFPALGVYGSAIGTLIARTIMALLLIIYVFNNKSYKDFLPNLVSTFNTWPVIVKIIKIGIPGGLQLFFEIGAYTGAAVFVGWLGTDELAAHQIALCLAAITYMLASGLAVAGSIQVGTSFGANNKATILRNGISSLVITALFMMICCFLFIYHAEELVRLFIKDVSVSPIAVSIVIIAGFFQLSDGIQSVGLGILRGIEDVNMPTIITLIAYWGIALPVGYFIGFILGYGIEGIWFGLLIGLTVSAVFLTSRFFYLVTKNKTKVYKATQLQEL